MSENHKEFRFKRGNVILDYISKFSSTEKFIFGALVIASLVTVIGMLTNINEHFLIQIPANGGELREGMIGLPRTINPTIAITDTDKDISSLVYAGLLKYSDNGLVPDLADSYTISTDGLTYDFKLKDDLRFQDDTPLTADDIAFTIQKVQDPNLKSPRRADWSQVSVKVISPTEIQFILKQPYSPFITNTTIGIIPKHIWGNVSNDQFIFSEFNIKPIGAGPYKVAGLEYDSGGIPTTYKLETWNDYYATKPYISNITFAFFNDEEKALTALDSGYIDSLASVSATPAARLATDSAQAYKIISTPLPRIFGIFLNQNHNSILADKIVRQALDMSVDRNALIKNVLSGYGEAIHSPLPSGLNPSATSTFNMNADIIGAQNLLEKNGWRKGSDGIYTKKISKTASTTLAFELYTSDTPDLKQTVDLVQKNWSDLGIHVTVKIFEAGDLYQNVIRTRSYDALLFGEQIGKDRDLYAFWHSSQRNSPGLNVSMYTNSKADKLLETLRSSNDSTTRTSAFTQFDSIIQADIPAIFLYSPDFIYAVPKDLGNISLHSITVPADRFNSINNWYIRTEKVWNIGIFTKK